MDCVNCFCRVHQVEHRTSNKVSQGIPNHWEFRVSRRNLLKRLNSLCILLIWPVFYKDQHFCSLLPIVSKLCAAWWQGTSYVLPHVKYVTFTTLVNKPHLRNLRSLSWYYAGILRLSWCKFNVAHIDNLLHSQQHNSCHLVAKKRVITNTCELRNSGSIDD